LVVLLTRSRGEEVAQSSGGLVEGRTLADGEKSKRLVLKEGIMVEGGGNSSMGGGGARKSLPPRDYSGLPLFENNR